MTIIADPVTAVSTQTGSYVAVKMVKMLIRSTTTLAALVLVLEVMATVGGHHKNGCRIPGSPCNISLNDRHLQKLVFIAAQEFNNETNDAFLFKPAAILGAQRQIVKGILYIVDLDLSRTVCKKQVNMSLSQCDFQPPGLLHQTFRCHSDIWSIPWMNRTRTQIKCRP